MKVVPVQDIVLILLLITANVFGVGMIVPQAVRLHRTQSAEGVSVVWIGVGIAMNGWWAAYAVSQSLWGLLPVAVGGAALYLIMTGQMFGLLGIRTFPPLLMGALVLGMIPLPFFLTGGMTAAGLAAGFCYGGQFTPAVVASLRPSGLVGLSASTWSMALVEAVIFVIYGAMVSDAALFVGGLGGSMASSIILLRLVSVRGVPATWLTPKLARTI